MSLDLSEAQLAHWRERGWLAVPRAFSADHVSRIGDWVGAVSQPVQPGDRRLHYFEETEAGPAICRTEGFLDDHEELRRLITEGALPALMAALSGEPMLIYKEKINYKHPGGAGFAPHQDLTAYPHVELNITALAPIDPMTAENGCLELAEFGARARLPNDGRGCLPPATAEALRWRPLPLAPGDVLIFTSYVPHRSGPNRSASSRRALYLTYNRAAEGDLRARYYAERARYLSAEGGARGAISMIGHFQGTTHRENGR